MSLAASSASPNTVSTGFTTRRIVVSSVSADGATAVCLDGGGTEVRVSLLWQRAKGVLPQPGEQWIIAQDMTASWSFATFIGTSAAQFPAVPGSWTALAFSGAGTFTGTSRCRQQEDGILVQVSGEFSAAGSPSASLGSDVAVAFPWAVSGAGHASVTTSGTVTIAGVTASAALGFCQLIPLT